MFDNKENIYLPLARYAAENRINVRDYFDNGQMVYIELENGNRLALGDVPHTNGAAYQLYLQNKAGDIIARLERPTTKISELFAFVQKHLAE